MSEFHRLDATDDARFLRARVADPLTRVPFRPTNEVVLCDTCGQVSLRETWEALGGCPNGHNTAARWSTAAALSAGDGAATKTPAPPPPPAPESRGRVLTWLLVAVGVAGLIVLGVVIFGLVTDREEAPVVQPAAPTDTGGLKAVAVAEPGLLEGALTEDDFATPDGRFQDLYTFAADSSGYVLTFRASSDAFYPDLVVETPEGERVAAELVSDDPDTGTRIVTVAGLRGPGLYRVLIASRLPGQTGAYALRIVSQEPVRPLSPNGPAVRAELGAFSQKVEGFNQDRYRFSGAEGREHTITVRSSAFAPTVQLQGPGGAVRGETGRAGGVVTFVFTPERSGTHTLVVSSRTANQKGDYSVQLVVEAPAVAPPPPTLQSLPTTGRAVSDSLATGDTKSYGIRGRVGDRIQLEVRTDGFTPSLTLVGPDGTRTPAAPDGDRARLRQTLSSAGTYRVIVGAPNGGGVARVTLEQQAAVAAEDIPRLPGADGGVNETPPAPQDGGGGQGGGYQPQPIDDGAPDGGQR